MITGMLSPGTLAAFSAGVSQVGIGQANLVQRVRSVAVPPTQPAATPAAPLTGANGVPVQGQKLPRGSLLDLSV
jgi:hypothetical protein